MTDSMDNAAVAYAIASQIKLRIESGPIDPGSGTGSGGGSKEVPPAQNQKENVLTPAASADRNGQGSVQLAADALKQAIKAVSENQSSEVVIRPAFSGALSKAVVTLPGGSAASIASDTSADLKIETPLGSVTLPNDALASIAFQASGGTVTVSIESAKTSSLTAEQQKVVGESAVYDISILSGGEHISSFGGKSITISLPYTLKSGEGADGVTVWYLTDSGTLEKLSCRYDASTGLATFTTSHLSAYVVGYEVAWKNPFSDVKAGDWYYDAVEYALENKLFNGTTAKTFSPKTEMTRAMLVTVLYRMEGRPAVAGADNSFQDVKSGQWYTDAATWAAANGIVGGYGNGLFGIDNNVSREQMAAILYRYAGYKQHDVTGAADLSAFTDAASVDSWAKPAIQWAGAEGLINGTTAETLTPGGFATRAQVATVLMRFAENAAE
ncbi:MAG TPA: S-layer homology domain-containing protein [Anaerovoracaceae bacterium]|nr:S-layer homology domain-containing protein [Anaerovoracaceae bacterium]